MSHRKPGTIPELKLQVRYHGIKATQYFAKFTQESDAVFRQDLLALKLPHPRRDNTTFISHGCIECVWPEVPRDGALHRNLKLKSDPDQQTMDQLSISKIILKEIYYRPPKVNSPKHAKEIPRGPRSPPCLPSHDARREFPLPPKPDGENLPPKRNNPKHSKEIPRPPRSPPWPPSYDAWRDGEDNRPPRGNELKRAREDIPQGPSFSSHVSARWSDDYPLLQILDGEDSQRPSKIAKTDHGDISAFSSEVWSAFRQSTANGRKESTSSSEHTPMQRLPWQFPPGSLPNDAQSSNPQKAIASNNNLFATHREFTSSPSLPMKKPPRAISPVPFQIDQKASVSNVNAPATHRGSTSFSQSFPMNPSLLVPPDPLNIERQAAENLPKATTSVFNAAMTPKESALSSAFDFRTKDPLPYNSTSAPGPPSMLRDTDTTFRKANNDLTIPWWLKAAHESQVKTPSVFIHTVKQEPSETFIPPLAAIEPIQSSSRESAPNPGRDTSSHPQPATHHQEPNPSIAKEKGDVLVQDFLKSLKQKMDTQNATTLTANDSHQTVDSFLKSLAPDVQQVGLSNSPSIPWDTVAAALSSTQGAGATSSSLAPGQVSDVPNDSQAPPSLPALTRTIKASVLPTPPPSAPFVEPSVSILPGDSYGPVASEHASTDQSLNFVPLTPRNTSASPPSAQVVLASARTSAADIALTQERRRLDQMGRRGSLYEAHESRARPPIADSDFVTIQRLTREAWDIKREIAAKAAREAAIIIELKELNSAWLPDPVVDSEEMKDRMARMERELEEEKRLRHEAENAIMDIRRECRAPFVVPSLLDAFVDISKLTTRALHPVDPEPSAESESSEDMRMEEILDEMRTPQPQESSQTHVIEPPLNTSTPKVKATDSESSEDMKMEEILDEMPTPQPQESNQTHVIEPPLNTPTPKVKAKKKWSRPKHRAKWAAYLSRPDVQRIMLALTPSDVAADIVEPGLGTGLANICEAAGLIWHKGVNVDLVRLGELLNQARQEEPQLVPIVEHFWKCRKYISPSRDAVFIRHGADFTYPGSSA